MRMPPATATLSDSTGGAIGIVTRSSHWATTSSDSPGPSPPRSSATGPVQSMSSGARPSRGDRCDRSRAGRLDAVARSSDVGRPSRPAAAVRCPCCRAAPSTRTGCADAPQTSDAGDAAGFGRANQRAEIAGILHVDGDEDEPVRACSRWRSASIGVRRAMATMPDGERTGLMAAKTVSVTLKTGTPSASSARASSPSSVCSGKPGRGDGHRLEVQPGRVRVTHQVNAVEQQPRAGRVRLARQLTERADDRILAARDRLHQRLGICRA